MHMQKKPCGAGIHRVRHRSNTGVPYTTDGAGRRARRGFTLVELLLVLVILAVLAMVVVPKFTGRSEQARVTAARTDITNIETALDAFEVDCGRYPSSDEGLLALLQPPGNVQNWRGPYLKKGVPSDPWGHPYVYRFPGTRTAGGYDLYSFGPDGREGNDDITNWD
ncbi:MAG: hypothetical protein AMXMBFR83_02250 [Phycisphaerae bacterium]